MSLATILTPRHLRILAGHVAYLRGADYWSAGNVLSYEVADEMVEGIVEGGARYKVRLAAHGNQLISECTCPVGAELCKHGVALGLAFHETKQSELAVPAPPPSGNAFETRKQLEAWVAEHHVAHALRLSAESLLASLPTVQQQRMRYLLGGMAIREVASREAASRRGMLAFEPTIVEAARTLFEREAEAVRTGIAEEQVPRVVPAEPRLAQLFAKLADARCAIRAEAYPRSRAARSTGTWAAEPRVPQIVWRERDRVFREYSPEALVVRFTLSGAGEPQLECSCGVPRCTHGLALLDATLDRLAEPTAELAEIAEELLRPGWSRALEDLDRFAAKAAKPRPTIEVWWQIEHELRALVLTPTVKKQTKRGMSSGARISIARMLDEYRDVLSEQDLRVAEYAVSWAPGRGTTYASRAFAALVGHPRIVTEHSERPVPLVRTKLGFTAHATGDHIMMEPSLVFDFAPPFGGAARSGKPDLADFAPPFGGAARSGKPDLADFAPPFGGAARSGKPDLAGERLPPRRLDALLADFAPGEPLFVYEADRERCLMVDVGDDARQLWATLARHGSVFPPESHAALLERLARMENRMPLAVPESLKGRELPADVAVVARLRLLPDVTLELELFIRPGEGAPLFAPGSGPRDVLVVRDGERGYLRRALGDELALARNALLGLPMETAEEGPPNCFSISEPEEALTLVAALQEPHPRLVVEWIDQKPHVGSAITAKQVRVTIDRKRDWFGMNGDAKVESGRLELAVLLDAARRQQRFVRVDENRWIELADTLRTRLLAISDQTYTARAKGASLELSPGAVSAINALAELGAHVTAAPDWKQLEERLAASLELEPTPPAGLTAKLRDYQVAGHAWLSRVAAWGAGACLADDMGLGKTVQAIAVLLDRAKLGPALVLAPTSVAYNWVNELARFAPTLRAVIYGDAPDRAKCLAGLKKKDVLIASYGLLVRDAEQLAKPAFATLVVDEAQALKNPTTRRARAARALTADFRIALSGTPFENHLGELWSLYAIIFPSLLGSWEQFRERYAAPIEKSKDTDASAALSRVLRPVLLRRTKQEVARELPSRTEIQVPVVLSKEEWELYEDARLAAVVELDDRTKDLRDEQRRFQVLAALTRLRLLASHPKLYDPRSTIASSKLRRLLELLEELRSEGHRALVFSQFTSHLALVREELERAKITSLYLDGSTPAAQRGKLIDAFQAGEGDVFLLSLKAGGTGINLTAADYVIHLDPWWNPAVEDQATDRAHRIGQTKPVTVFRLIARGTIEEQILAMHADKRALVAGILEGSDVAARLTTRDLLALLAAGHRPTEEGDSTD